MTTRKPLSPAPSRAQRLAEDAAEAAEVRAYQVHPDVVALRIERVRAQVDRMCWTGIVLGLAFTMTNVQAFASAGTRPWSLPWLAAWVLDPTVSLVLLAILRAEEITARYQVRTGPWVRRAKWFTLVATYAMNTWASYVAGSASAIVLHSVPPLVVFVAVEAITDLRERLTDAARAAAAGHERLTVHEPAQAPGGQLERQNPRRRKLFGDYLTEARAAWSPGTVVSGTGRATDTDLDHGPPGPRGRLPGRQADRQRRDVAPGRAGQPGRRRVGGHDRPAGRRSTAFMRWRRISRRVRVPSRHGEWSSRRRRN